jgi:hypothetical protein
VLRPERVPRFLDIWESLVHSRVTNTKTQVRKLDAMVMWANILRGKHYIKRMFFGKSVSSDGASEESQLRQALLLRPARGLTVKRPAQL